LLTIPKPNSHQTSVTQITEKSLIQIERNSMMRITRTANIGKFLLNYNDSDVVVIPQNVVGKLESILDDYPTSSLIVRLDMAPWDGEGVPPIYEFEVSPGGLMFSFESFPWEKVSRLADSAVCLHGVWMPAYERLAELMDWKLSTDWNTAGRIYFSGNATELPNDIGITSRIITDPWSDKSKVIAINGGELVDENTETDLGKLRSKYPDGFVLKPVDGWGARDIHMYGAVYSFAKWEAGKKQIKALLLAAKKSPGTWMLQPFFAPEVLSSIFGEFRIWRVYAVRDTIASSFKLIGGTWNSRGTTKIHGASNTVVGEVRVEE
jgi:hypothetical protein